jgi:phospholipid/cholesterol/gamma-HCH transport system ATP-binding protein
MSAEDLQTGASPNPPPEERGETIISAEGITARFGEETILSGVTFQIRRGEIFAVLGGSGCGKTVLLKHLVGLYRPYSGRVRVLGTDITAAEENELVRLRRKMGVLFQSGALLGSLTLAENVALPLQAHTDLSPAAVEEIVEMKLALVNLSGYENHLPEELSGGMKKRAGLARAMALDPEILFFDEPTGGLDPVTAAEMDNLIKSLNTGLGTTMVVVTHDLPSIFGVASRVIMLDKGARGIIAEGDPRALKANTRDPRIIHFFNRQAEERKGGES